MSSQSSAHGERVEASDGGNLSEEPERAQAYVQRPLPTDLTLPTETHRALAMAEHTLGELNESTRRLPHGGMFALCTRLREVQNMAQLAGTSLDLTEAWLIELLLARATGDSAEQVLRRHPIGRVILAFAHGAARVEAGAVVDGELIGEIDERLTGTVTGSTESRLRTRQSWLSGRSTNQIPILTTPPGAMLHGAFALWSTWAPAPHPLPRIGKISLGHLNLKLMDPFENNGVYLSCIYTSLEMVCSRLLRGQVLSLASWLDENAGEYHDRISAVVDGAPIEQWIDFFARGVQAQAAAQLRLIQELDRLRESMLKRVGGSSTMRSVVAGLMTAPVTSNRALEAMYGIADRTATQITRKLEDHEVVENVGRRTYNKVFVCQPVLDLYALQTPLASESDRAVFSPPAN